MPDISTAGALLAADSFRVREFEGSAQVRGFSLHLTRFAATVGAAAAARVGPDWMRGTLPRFLALARTQIAESGAGFPRLELWHQGATEPQLALSLRELPLLTETLAMRSAPDIDLVHPERKGPNIAQLSALNRTLGAEALLLDRAGRVLEGATTSVLWWEQETLCRTASAERVASVTERIVLSIARDMGISIASRELAPDDLARREAWAVNALHGIRPISTIDAIQLPEGDGGRLARFRSALDQSWEPVLDAEP